MGQRKYPPLTPSEVKAILKILGFTKDRQDGSHEQHECPAIAEFPRSVVTVDVGYKEFDTKMMQALSGSRTVAGRHSTELQSALPRRRPSHS